MRPHVKSFVRSIFFNAILLGALFVVFFKFIL